MHATVQALELVCGDLSTATLGALGLSIARVQARSEAQATERLRGGALPPVIYEDQMELRALDHLSCIVAVEMHQRQHG